MGSELVDRWDFPVKPAKLEDLARRFEAFGLREADLEERFVLGQGKGGQKINKTHSAVQLLHVPTGTRVECHRERERSLNRFLARRLLVEALERDARGGMTEAEEKERDKIRKQKQRSKRRSRSKTARTSAETEGTVTEMDRTSAETEGTVTETDATSAKTAGSAPEMDGTSP